MKLIIQARDFTLTESLKKHIERRINFALSFASDKINWIEVILGDENGPRGGIDQYCQVRLKVPGLPVIVNSQKSVDLYSAIDASLHVVRRSLSRRINRLNKRTQKTRNYLHQLDVDNDKLGTIRR